MKSKHIAILETRLGQQLADLVRQRGGVPFHAPALAELPDLDPQAIAALVRSLESAPAKLAIFQTGVGTRALFAATDSLGITGEFLRILERLTVAARGPKPTGALRARKVRIDRQAADPFTTHEVLQGIKDIDLQNARVIVQRYGVANAELDRALYLSPYLAEAHLLMGRIHLQNGRVREATEHLAEFLQPRPLVGLQAIGLETLVELDQLARALDAVASGELAVILHGLGDFRGGRGEPL